MIERDILDDDWEPRFDRHYQRDLTLQEQYDQNQEDLNQISGYLAKTPEERAAYLDELNDIVDSLKESIRECRELVAEPNISPEAALKYRDLHDQAYDMAYGLRRKLLLLEHPDSSRAAAIWRREMIILDLAQVDSRYRDALGGMDPEIIDQNIDAILESVPPREFDKLANLMDRSDKWPVFRKQVQDVLERALGLEDVNIKVEMFAGFKGDDKGDCTRVDDGYRVRLNSSYIEQDAWEYAKILAHEFYHVMQDQVSRAGGTEMADLYDLNQQHYGRPELIGYGDYKAQLKEAEAFRFMDRFLREIRKGEQRNQRTLTGRVKHWWKERDTEKLPDRPIADNNSHMPRSDSEKEVLLGADEADKLTK